MNLNSPDEQKLFDNLLYDILIKISEYLQGNDMKKAEKLIKLLDKYANDRKHPYQNESLKKYLDDLKQHI